MKTKSFMYSVLLGLSALAPSACSSANDADSGPVDIGGSSSSSGSAGSAGAVVAVGGGSSGESAGAGAGAGGEFSGAGGGIAGSASGGMVGSVSGGAGGAPSTAPLDPTDLSVWKLVWSDEFDAADGSAPDAKKWTHEIRTQAQTGNKNGNKELQQYTADAANSQQKGGMLSITAIKQSGASGTTYTSARLNTLGHYSVSYGRVEARIKMPGGKGVWPAFWMLGDNKPTVGWPNCGEIDIMETKGSQIDTNHGSLHGPVYNGGKDLTDTITLPGKPKLSDDFHVYATEWSKDVVKFYVDTTLYETRTPKDMPPGGTWVFNHPFFITLNLAIGGVFDGNPTDSTPFPAELLVDYVRVYAPK